MATVVVLDYGSQYTQLIARRLRELRVYSVILPHDSTLTRIQLMQPATIVISGGPTSVYDQDAPALPQGLLEMGVPILAICYGMQLVAQACGGQVMRSSTREYGQALLTHYQGALFASVTDDAFAEEDQGPVAWMSHGDSVTVLPEGFEVIASTADTAYAALYHPERKITALQFHPEVNHTSFGKTLLDNFLKLHAIAQDWQPEAITEALIKEVCETAGDAHVLLGISGGVDSSTLGLLLSRALKDKLHAVFVDHGLLRAREAQEVELALQALGVNLIVVDAQERFLTALAGVSDPEKKRKIIGHAFIEVFSEEARKLQSEVGPIKFLAQGTLYPDVVESAGGHGAANIKSHHNVGGLPDDLAFELLEPFRTLFKDEVREIARTLGLPETLTQRHPFPGPGLAIRCLGEVTHDKLEVLRRVDDIFITSLKEFGLYDQTWQALAVLTPLRTVGVMGDGRTYTHTVALRAVSSVDGMTADWTRFPHEFLAAVSNRIVNQVSEVNRVVYDITSKPPGTIEWE